MMNADASSPVSDATARRLRDARQSLLALHKKLLDAERSRYERTRGRIGGPGALLQLVLNDPWFAWLRPLTALVVQIDERLAEDDPLLESEAEAFLDEMRSLIRLEGGDGTFERHYHEALQEHGDVAVAYRDLLAHLS